MGPPRNDAALKKALAIAFTRCPVKALGCSHDALRFVCTGLSLCREVRVGVQKSMPARSLSLFLDPYGNFVDPLAWLGRYPDMVARVDVLMPTCPESTCTPEVSCSLKFIGAMLRHHPHVQVALDTCAPGYVPNRPFTEFCQAFGSPFVWPDNCEFRLSSSRDMPDPTVSACITNIRIESDLEDDIPQFFHDENGEFRQRLKRIHRVCSAPSSQFTRLLSTFPALEEMSITISSEYQGDPFDGMESGYPNLQHLGISCDVFRLQSVPSVLKRRLKTFGVIGKRQTCFTDPVFWNNNIEEFESLQTLILPRVGTDVDSPEMGDTTDEEEALAYELTRLRTLKNLGAIIGNELGATIMVVTISAMPWLRRVTLCPHYDFDNISPAAATPLLRGKLEIEEDVDRLYERVFKV